MSARMRFVAVVVLGSAWAFAAGSVIADEQTILFAPFESIALGRSPAEGVMGNLLVTGARLAQGVQGKGLALNGKDDAALALDPGVAQDPPAFTVEAWVRLRTYPKGRAVVAGKRRPGEKDWDYLLAVDKAGAPLATFLLNRAGKTMTVRLAGQARIPLGRFFHLAASVNESRHRLSLFLDGEPVDTVWLDSPFRVSGAAGKVWIGWGPPEPQGEPIVGWPGALDELRVSAGDRSPFALDSIAGWKLAEAEWLSLRAKATLEFDRFPVRAGDLLLKGIGDAPTFIEWRLRDAARWFENRETSQLEEAMRQCDGLLGSLEKRSGALRIAPHPMPESVRSLAPEIELTGERGLFAFRVRRVSLDRADVLARSVAGETAAWYLCLHERARILPLDVWHKDGGQPARFSTTADVPSARGAWKLCVFHDPGIVALSVEGRELLRMAPGRARQGALLSVFDLAHVLEEKHQELTLELAGEAGDSATPLRALLADADVVSYAAASGGWGRSLIAGDRFTVVAFGSDGSSDQAFFDFSGNAPEKAATSIPITAVPLVGLAVSPTGPLLPCEFRDLVAQVGSFGGNVLSLPLDALERPGESCRLAVSVDDALDCAQASEVRLCLRMDAHDVNGFLESLSGKTASATRAGAFLVELDSQTEVELARARADLRKAGFPEASILAPRFDGRFTDGRTLRARVGRSPDMASEAAAPSSSFLGPDGWRGRLRSASYLWNAVLETPGPSNSGLGVEHPANRLLEARLLAQSLGLAGIMLAVERSAAWENLRPLGDPGESFLERTALLAGALPATQSSSKEGTSLSVDADALLFETPNVSVLASRRRACASRGGLEFWNAGPVLTGEPSAIVASLLDPARAAGIIVASCEGTVRVPWKRGEVWRVYGVNAFGCRILEVPFFRLGEDHLVIAVPGDPSACFYEISCADSTMR